MARQKTPAPNPEPETAARFAGSVDGIVDGAVCGWSANLSERQRRVTVSLYDGETHVASMIAADLRTDVAATGLGDGQCGFRLPLPASILDGKVHTLHVRVAGTKLELRNSPLGFGPTTLPALLLEVASLREKLARLEAQFSKGSTYQQAVTEPLVKDLLRRFDTLFMIQRDNFEREFQVMRNDLAALREKARRNDAAVPKSKSGSRRRKSAP